MTTDDDLEAELRELHRIATLGGEATIYSRSASRIAQLEADRAVWRNAAKAALAELHRYVPCEYPYTRTKNTDNVSIQIRTDLYERIETP